MSIYASYSSHVHSDNALDSLETTLYIIPLDLKKLFLLYMHDHVIKKTHMNEGNIKELVYLFTAMHCVVPGTFSDHDLI